MNRFDPDEFAKFMRQKLQKQQPMTADAVSESILQAVFPMRDTYLIVTHSSNMEVPVIFVGQDLETASNRLQTLDPKFPTLAAKLTLDSDGLHLIQLPIGSKQVEHRVVLEA